MGGEILTFPDTLTTQGLSLLSLNIVLDPKLELSGCELNDVKRLCRRRHELSPVGWTRVAETLWVNAGTVGRCVRQGVRTIRS